MKKHFKVTNLDCANCAAKLENGMKKLDGVKSASVNFMTQKLTLEADDETFADVLAKASALCKKLDSKWDIVK